MMNSPFVRNSDIRRNTLNALVGRYYMIYEDGDWVDFPLFDDSVELVLHDDGPISQEYIKSCVDMLQFLSDETIEQFCDGSIHYCESMSPHFDELGIAMPQHVSKREILKYIQPCSIILDPPEGEGAGFYLGMNCDWEPEHGLQ